jgi:lipoate-protein ligase A
MKFLVLSTTNPYYNLAVEEYLFNTASDCVFMLWQNDKTVVIGKNQNAHAEVDRAVLDKYGVYLARRITGGGAVYHDLGNVNYSFINPNSKTGGIDFEYFTKPIIKALKTLGVNVKLSGRNDLETESGLKISGSAQHRVGNRVLHHGTLLFSSDLDFMSKVLTPDRDKLKSKAVKSVKKRVINVCELSSINSVSEFINAIKNQIITEFNAEVISPPISQDIDRLYARNSSYEWIFPEKPMVSSYQKTVAKRYDFGKVELTLNLENERIKSIKITGDFFGENDVAVLERTLENTLIEDIKNIDISAFILGMTSREFIDLIKS